MTIIPGGMDPIFAFRAIQVVVYFGSVVALLYYYGIMQAILKRMAWLMQLTLGTTATESINACACIFLGMVVLLRISLVTYVSTL